MSAGLNRGEASVLCPYYRSSSGKVIECDGGLDPGGVVQNRFKTRKRREKFMESRCCGKYAACALCRANDAAEGFTRPPSA